MSGPELQTRVTLDGDFFRRHPGKTIYGNVRDLMDALAEWGERDVSAQIAAHEGGMPGWTGWSLGRVKGRTSANNGKRWAVTAVVTLNTSGLGAAEAIRTKAAGAGRYNPFPHGTAPGIESRWHPFRSTAGRLRGARPLLTANLTRGLE